MTSIYKQVKSLAALRGHITKSIKECEILINENPIPYTDLEETYTTLKGRWSKYSDKYSAFQQYLIDEDASEEEAEKHAELHDKYQADYDQRIILIRRTLASKPQLSTTSPVANTTGSASLPNLAAPRLPTINLPNFSGDNDSWSQFYDMFCSLVHNRADLDEVTKFNYLKGQLLGEAKGVIEHLPTIMGNYNNAIALLKADYGDAERSRARLIYKLIDLKSPRYEAQELQHFRIEVDSGLKALANHTVVDNIDWVLALFLQRKLPREIINSLYTLHRRSYFTLDEMSESLRTMVNHIRAHEVDRPPQPQKMAEPKSHRPVDKSHKKPQQDKWKSTQVGTYTATEDPQNKGPVSSKFVAQSNRSNRNQCLFCENEHYSSLCHIFDDYNSRQARLKRLQRCGKCLRQHKTADCTTELRECSKCHKGRHHIALCNQTKLNSSESSTTSSFCKVTAKTHNLNSSLRSTDSALPTATVSVGSDQQHQQVRVLLDQGSQRTFISQKLVDSLQLQPISRVTMSVAGINAETNPKEYDVVQPEIRLGRWKKKVMAVVLNKLPSCIHVKGLKATVDKLKAKGIRLADKYIDSDQLENVELLIGVDHYNRLIQGTIKREGLTLLKSPGGYLLADRIPRDVKAEVLESAAVETVVVTRVTSQISPLDLTDLVEEGTEPVHKLWELDSIGINPEQQTPDDALTYQNYLDTVKYDQGQYWVRLPWKINPPHLPNNYKMAKGQLKSQISKCSKHHLELYHQIIQQQLQNNFIEKVDDADLAHGHYLPHHAVKKDSLTTPLRIVFNCSARANHKETSLNDCLLTGPSLTQKLGDVLLKFRLNPLAYTADISKAFLRIGLQEEDRDFTKFLWPEDPNDPHSQILTYRFASVLFGATSSPFLLQATLDTHMKNSQSPYKALINANFYVDNFQGTTDSESELYQIYKEANKEMNRANMPLQTWTTNSQSLKQRIEGDCPNYQVPESTTVLGLSWNNQHDTLNIKPVSTEIKGPLTKRRLLSLVSRVFDPLGLISPITIKGKILMQESWQCQIGWDDELPPQLQLAWGEIAPELQLVHSFVFPRMVAERGEPLTLHIFCDASMKAYGAVAYLATACQSFLVTSKARVAPLAKRSLPQLELTAISVGTRLGSYLLQVLSELDITRTVIWADNEAALQWVKSDKCSTPYVKNRVAEIRALGKEFVFRHVPTKENPADLLSRGVLFKHLQNNTFWTAGPTWLTDETKWPPQKMEVVSEGPVVMVSQVVVQKSVIDPTRYSSLDKLLRVTALVFKFLGREKRGKPTLDPLKYWIKQIQGEVYSDELEFLGIDHKGKPPKAPKIIINLGLYKDEDDLLRCRGRLQKADLPTSAIHPLLLPKAHCVTGLIAKKAHYDTQHGGVQDTLSYLRNNYWIPQARQLLKKLVRHCVLCRRYEGRRCEYPGPPPLPEGRVVHHEPFEHTGVDYTGALTITNTTDGRPMKTYICLFTCATSRAVHLEVAVDLSAETFLRVFRRFVARRSCPRVMISDNGTNFVAGEGCLRNIFEHPETQTTLKGRRCVWKFIPPKAPWQGGFYERMVGTVKRCLRKVLHGCKLSLDELQTIVTEVEARVNNRPLNYLIDELDTESALTPSKLLHGRSILPAPTVIVGDPEDPTYQGREQLQGSYDRLTRVLHRWKDIWRREYLTSLREHHYGALPTPNVSPLQPGDVVLVEAGGSRSDWPLGRVVSIHPDAHGVLRVVKVSSQGTISLRTIEKLVPLEPSEEVREATPTEEDSEENTRPTRAKAQACRQRLRGLIRDGDL